MGEKRLTVMNRTDTAKGTTPLPEGCTLLDALPAKQVRLQLTGTFAGEPIIWDANVEALGTNAKSYLDVQDATAGRGTIQVGLPVEIIDAPTLHKSVIMIRQYRALRLGRHQFGTG